MSDGRTDGRKVGRTETISISSAEIFRRGIIMLVGIKNLLAALTSVVALPSRQTRQTIGSLIY
jgi:hypothetical protein